MTMIETSHWHLTHSQPTLFLDYFNPTNGFITQINILLSRFRAVQTLCSEGETDEIFTQLRNELAFHLVKMSRWWGFDFCPQGLTGVRNPLFLTYVKAHTARNYIDDCFFDLFTMQRHMHGGDAGHIMVLGSDPFSTADHGLFYGVDGKKSFRFATRTEGQSALEWHRYSYPDFASAWLAAWSTQTAGGDVRKNLSDYMAAEREHACARTWHQRYFHRHDQQMTTRLYVDATQQLAICKSPFGKAEFESIVNSLAFNIVHIAHDRSMTISDLITENQILDGSLRTANTLKHRARAHVAVTVDPCLKPKLNALLDSTLSYVPRRCSGA
ncbi:hypothetical protein [Acetobacter cibinongensis]|uniref:Uncharacterized protein n=1 Tax=Acetobacter cibinongensis TaxID=146475 RepID=A0A1Z5YVT3_9PROT|nr:hypothetical protein [Acetobacter cibinongensis]OUJ03085.1 hypothetical protein HK14_03480 [Acetobacter cibinongensis]